MGGKSSKSVSLEKSGKVGDIVAGKEDELDEVKEAVKDKKKKEKEQPAIPPVPYFTLYRYASGKDKAMLFFAFISALAAGAMLPLMIVLFGDMTQTLIDPAQTASDGEYCCNYTQKYCTTTTEPPDFSTTLAPPVVDYEKFIDDMIDLTIKMCAIGLGSFILNYVFMFGFNFVAENIVHRIRGYYLEALLRQDVGWYDTNHDKNFVSRIAEDLVKIQDAIGEKVPLAIFFAATSIASLITAFAHGWLLTLVVLSSFPVIAIVTGAVAGIMSKIASTEQQAYAKAGNVAEEAITNIKTVMAFSGAEKEIERYQIGLESAKAAGKKRALFSGLSMGLMWLVMYMSYALAFWYGTRLILDGRDSNCDGESSPYDAGKLLIVFFCVMMGAFNIGQSFSYLETFAMGRGAGAVIYSVIDRIPPIDSYSDKGKKPTERSSGRITFENIRFSYPSRPEAQIMKNFSLSIKPGQTVALVGHSGCGKSTCLQLLQRFYDPLSGKVTVDGTDIKDLHLGWLRSQIGIVSQEPILFNTTIAENIRYGREGVSDKEIEEACRKSNAHTFIAKLPLRYETPVGDRGAQLSGGQKQRIAIARALVRNPPILLLDEATSALDTQSESIVQNALDRAREGRTTLIVAHRLSTIRAADLVVSIEAGEVAEMGTHIELLKAKGLYFQLVTAQMNGLGDDELDPLEEEAIGVKRQSSFQKKPSISLDDDEVAAIVPVLTEGTLSKKELEQQAPFTRLIKLNGKEWPYIAVGIIMSIIQGASFPAFSIIFGEYLKILSGTNRTEIEDDSNFYAILFLVLGVGAGVSMYLQIFTFSWAGEELTFRLRKMSFAAMLRQELGWFDDENNNIGALCARLAGDAAGVQGATGTRVGSVIQSIATIGIAIGLGMYYMWKLGLVAMAFGPIIVLAAYFQGMMMAGSNILEKDAIENASKIAVQAVSNIRTVASLCKERFFVQRYLELLESTHTKVKRLAHGRGALFGLSQGIPFVAYGIVMFYGGYLIRDDGAPYENVFKTGQALIIGTMMVGQAMAFTPNYSKAKLSGARILKLLDRKPLIDSSKGVGLRINNAEGSVLFQDVAFNYPTRPGAKILRALSLGVEPGKSVALVGPSGCGKSTTIQLIMRYYDPVSGKVKLDEQDVGALNVDSLRSHMAIVAQEPALFDRTIAENIAYGDNSKKVDMDEIIRAAKQANIHNFIAGLPAGYETRVGEMGTQLSGGQKQRVAIARALLRNPKLLLLDEATSALDTESEAVVQEALDAASEGRTSVTIAHRLSSIQNVDKILVINNGELMESGTHSELLEKKGLYSVLWNIQGQKKNH